MLLLLAGAGGATEAASQAAVGLVPISAITSQVQACFIQLILDLGDREEDAAVLTCANMGLESSKMCQIALQLYTLRLLVGLASD